MNTVTVTQLNRYVSSILDSDQVLTDIYVSGEISSFKKYSSGHFYFNLKDQDCSVSCVMFRNKASLLNFKPSDGDKVIVRARASLYDRDGKFQLYINDIKPQGIGELFAAYEKLKKKLADEGLFDETVKKKIPLLPKRIGVATSRSGAVIRDIINVSTRRFPEANIQIYPVKVQGAGASSSIIRAIETFNDRREVDVIIIARGGGSMEDLWCFNDESLARAIYASKIPVVSAIGHETDFTISDFAADLRAPTPSAAAELVLPVKDDLLGQLKRNRERIVRHLIRKAEYDKLHLQELMRSRVFTDPYQFLDKAKERLDKATEKSKDLIKAGMDKNKSDLRLLITGLESVSPLRVLARGYGIIENKTYGIRVRSVAEVSPGDDIDIILKDGEINCEVTSLDHGRKSNE